MTTRTGIKGYALHHDGLYGRKQDAVHLRARRSIELPCTRLSRGQAAAASGQAGPVYSLCHASSHAPVRTPARRLALVMSGHHRSRGRARAGPSRPRRRRTTSLEILPLRDEVSSPGSEGRWDAPVIGPTGDEGQDDSLRPSGTHASSTDRRREQNRLAQERRRRRSETLVQRLQTEVEELRRAVGQRDRLIARMHAALQAAVASNDAGASSSGLVHEAIRSQLPVTRQPDLDDFGRSMSSSPAHVDVPAEQAQTVGSDALLQLARFLSGTALSSPYELADLSTRRARTESEGPEVPRQDRFQTFPSFYDDLLNWYVSLQQARSTAMSPFVGTSASTAGSTMSWLASSSTSQYASAGTSASTLEPFVQSSRSETVTSDSATTPDSSSLLTTHPQFQSGDAAYPQEGQHQDAAWTRMLEQLSTTLSSVEQNEERSMAEQTSSAPSQTPFGYPW